MIPVYCWKTIQESTEDKYIYIYAYRYILYIVSVTVLDDNSDPQTSMRHTAGQCSTERDNHILIQVHYLSPLGVHRLSLKLDLFSK